MKRSNLLITILIVGALIVIGFLLFAGESKKETNSKIKIAATIFPLYDIAKNISGDRATVVSIVPPSASPHTYEVTPEKVKKLQDTNVVFKIGHGADDWADNLSESISNVEIITADKNIPLKKFGEEYKNENDNIYENICLEHSGKWLKEYNECEDLNQNVCEEYGGEYIDCASACRHNPSAEVCVEVCVAVCKFEYKESNNDIDREHGEYDPHYWLSIENAKIIAKNITDKLKELDPASASVFQKNLDNYQDRLVNLKKESEAKVKNLSSNILVTTHNAWSYFADEFNLETVGTFQASPGKEPTPQELTELQELIEKHNVQALFSEPQLSEAVLKPFADDTGLKIYVLDPLGGSDNRNSYLEMIQYNVDTIYNALR